MEALINEMNEALRRITDYLTPRIDGVIPVSVQEKEECVEERKSLSDRITTIEAELAGVESQELPDGATEEEKSKQILTTVDGLPLQVYTRNEDAAVLIQCEVEAIIENINKDHLVVIGGLNQKLHLASEHELTLFQRIALLESDYRISEEHCKELSEENATLLQENNQYKLERDQSRLYETNAKTQLEEMAFELEQARIELNRNREVRALSEAERTAEQEAARQRFLDNRIKVYDVQWEDEIKRTHHIAKRAENGEPIRYGRLEAGGHVEITEEEALAIQAMNKAPEAPILAEVESQDEFQSADENAEASLPSGEQGAEQQDSDSDEQAVREDSEPETFEQRTERRLSAIERRLDKNEPEFFHEVA